MYRRGIFDGDAVREYINFVGDEDDTRAYDEMVESFKTSGSKKSRKRDKRLPPPEPEQ
ncbi:MAG: hypothetical protein NUW37_01695 [Planctomycetes bacterium]|nr:hypothetical protein [Planctomycetota bacterium]